jgi:hypothetical protein
MRRFRAPARVLVVAVSLLVVAASVLAVTASAQSGSRSNHRARPLHVTKECSQYAGGIGSYCTITSSNIAAITVGTRVFYAQAAGPTSLDSDVILYAGPGNTATGHVVLDFATGTGLLTLSGGTGTLDGIRARVNVSYLGGPNWAWDGTYRFHDDD